MTYKTNGTCATKIDFEIKDGKVFNVVNGNTQGVSHLVEGMPAEEVIQRLKGIKCGFKATSCPDQLANALSNALNV